MIKYKENQEYFTINDFGEKNIEWLANLFFKDVIVAENYEFNNDRSMMGVSANIDYIPYIKEKEEVKINLVYYSHWGYKSAYKSLIRKEAILLINNLF